MHKSYQEVSIKALAKKAKIATGTFYLYFSNKEALINMIVDEMFQELLACIKEERACFTDSLEASGIDESLYKIICERKRDGENSLVQVPGVNNAFNAKLIEIENEMIRFTRNDLDELKAQGGCRKKILWSVPWLL